MSIEQEVYLLKKELFDLKSTVYDYISYSQNVNKNVIGDKHKQSERNMFFQTSINDVNNRVINITPYMDSQRAYIGDTSTTFKIARTGFITVYCETDSGIIIPTRSEKTDNYLTVSFEALIEPATVTISII